MPDTRAYCSQCGLRIRHDLIGWLIRFETNGAIYTCPRCRPDNSPSTSKGPRP